MIRDQCHAFCQCSYCTKDPQEKTTNAGASMRAAMQSLNRPGMSKDELYLKSLQHCLREKAFLDSSKNVGRFIPDEQLLSSTKMREAKQMALAAELVPVRRRDRLQELLLLEHKARLNEEARLREERRALGLPDEDDEAVADGSANEAESVSPQAASDTSSQRALAAQQQRLSSGAATPASQCSAEHDLHAMLKGIRDIVDEDAGTAHASLSKQQVFKLRQLMHNQKKKTREMVDNCENQPHVCGHCLDVDVQARHLAPFPQESVAFGLTGKVINPEEGVKYGTEEPRGFDGTYSTASVDPAMVSKKARQGNYSNHPYGAGMVFLPVSSVNAGGSRNGKVNNQSTRFRASFNNNIGAGEAVDADLQFPGSTYNVYDKSTPQAGATPAVKKGTADRAVTIDSVSSNASSQNAINEQKDKPAAAAATTAAEPTVASSSALWRSTNQDRELDMRRFMEFQQKLKTNSKRVYEEGKAASV